jgi:hypothetical protein
VLVLPGLAWLLGHAPWEERSRLALVRVAVVADAVLMLVVGIEAFTDIPPLTPPLPLGVVSATALAVLVGTGAIALRAASVTRAAAL